eukprot:4550166-Alexandrium_andersonii.AAC.1
MASSIVSRARSWPGVLSGGAIRGRRAKRMMERGWARSWRRRATPPRRRWAWGRLRPQFEALLPGWPR